MISIKKLLASDNREAAEAFERMARLLLQAIGLHAVVGDHTDFDGFQTAVAGVQSSLAHDSSSENILVATGSAIEALQNYNRRTSAFLQAKTAELNSILGMLTEALSQMAALSESSVSRLEELRQQIEHAALMEDVRMLKARLSDCLESIRVEVARQRGESNQMISGLRQALRDLQEGKPVDQASATNAEAGDPLTGLPQKTEAKAAIAAACGPGSRVYAGLFVVDRIQSIQTRFGHKLADEALVFFLQYLSQTLAPSDKLFRWDEVSFLALLERRESADLVRRELSKALAKRSEQTFDLNGRPVALQLSSTWTVLTLFEGTHSEIVRKLEAFCASLGRV